MDIAGRGSHRCETFFNLAWLHSISGWYMARWCIKRLLRRFVLVVIGIALLSIGVELQASSPPCEQTTGSTTRETYRSALLGQTMYYTVYLPPCYVESEATYPVLYLMHGSNEDDGHWSRLGLIPLLDASITSSEVAPMVVVMPFGNVIANRNRFDAVSWGNIFTQELMPHIDATYRVTHRRAIGGISRGGFWAYHIGLLHPDDFVAIGGHSAFFDPYHAPPEANPLDLAADLPVNQIALWLDRGAADFAAPGLEIMHTALESRQIDHTYVVHPSGEHNNAYWQQHVADYLQFYADKLQSSSPSPPPVPSLFVTNTPFSPPTLPTLTTTPTPQTTQAMALFVPVVAFASLATTMTDDKLVEIRQGIYHDKLILSRQVIQDLSRLGIVLHPDTRLVDDLNALRDALWRDMTLFTLLPMDALRPDLRVLWMDDVPVFDQLDRYAFARMTATDGNFDPDKLTRITFSGVTALARNTRVALDDNGVQWAASGIADAVQRVDFFHVSNEVSMVATCPQASGVTLGGANSMCTRPAHMDLLTQLDVDIVELTGNHNNDYGYDAYQETLTWYTARDMHLVGGGETPAQAREPLRLSHGGNTMAWVACNAVGPYYALVNDDPSLLGGVRPGAAGCDWQWLQTTLPALAAQVDVVIVTIQHREFEEYVPTDTQRFDFRRLADWGADIVIGTAPHKPQSVEFYATAQGEIAFLHYGLGNLFFDQPFWGNMRFFMDTALVYDGQLRAFELFPGIIDGNARPRLMTPDERENFLFFMLRQHSGF